MKNYFFTIFLVVLIGCSADIVKHEEKSPQIDYYINLSDHSDDLFHITVNVNNLSNDNNIYHFAATAPGTYQILDFGRFVKNFSAYDKDGNKIEIENISTNQWKISEPKLLKSLKYDIEDSFDAGIVDYPVSPMCGSGIENDFIAMNTFAVLGYFEGLQTNPISLDIDYKSDWTIGTSLSQKPDGRYYAENFDLLADSPILIGDLSIAETFINDISVQVYVFSENPEVNADTVMTIAKDVLNSASGFIGYSPVPSYRFLICLLDDQTFSRNGLYGGGALEHSLSSLYVMPSNRESIGYLKSTMAHEFLHILTPLFLHSEIIHIYNFEEPTPSEHVWLYEGVTEWASDIMQLRSGLIDIERYMQIISNKLRMNDYFDQNVSLKEMALTSYSESGYGSFLNFYERGAVTASLLDLKILELSDGKRGLREVFLTLLKKYGKNRPFPEDNFYNIFVKETYPEIQSFFDRYIVGSDPLPIEEYFSKLGYNYIPRRVAMGEKPSLGTNISMNENMEIITIDVHEQAKEWGLKEGDIIIELLGENVSMKNIRDIFTEAMGKKIGDPLSMKVKRNEKIISINGEFLQMFEKHVFVEMDSLTEEQINFRKVWSRNL